MLKSSTVELDKTDKFILNVLQEDGRISNSDLAKRVHLSPPATLARVKRLEQEGYVKGYVSILNREKTGHDTICFISVSLELHQPDKLRQFFEAVRLLPQVQECHHLTLKANRSTGNERSSRFHGNLINGFTRSDIVTAVED